MSNQLSPDKVKICYAEWSDIRDELTEARREIGEKEGREITEAELLRTITLDCVNENRVARGERKLNLDPKSGPGGVQSHKKRPRRIDP